MPLFSPQVFFGDLDHGTANNYKFSLPSEHSSQWCKLGFSEFTCVDNGHGIGLIAHNRVDFTVKDSAGFTTFGPILWNLVVVYQRQVYSERSEQDTSVGMPGLVGPKECCEET